MEIEGKIIEDLGIRSGVSARTGESWRIASYVIETESMYPRRMMFSVSDGRNGRIAQMNVQVGKRMRIHFEIAASKGRDGMWYNQVNAFGARDLDAKAPEVPAEHHPQNPEPPISSSSAFQAPEATQLSCQQLKSTPTDAEAPKTDDLPF